jgi:hypothetical protein
MATAVPNALNGSAPERTPTVNVTQVTYSGLGSSAEDIFVVGTTPGVGVNAYSVTLSSTPATGTPLYVYRGGLRQAVNRDFTITGATITFSSAAFTLDETILVDYFV